MTRAATESGLAALPRLDPRERRGLVFFSAICAAALLASVIYAPYASNGPVLCPFRFATGLPCPGCGLTRSFCAMSHGQIVTAFEQHLFGPVLYVAAILCLPVMLRQLITGRRTEWFHRLVSSPQFTRALAIAFFGYHAVRMAVLISKGQVPYLIAHAPMIDWMHRP